MSELVSQVLGVITDWVHSKRDAVGQRSLVSKFDTADFSSNMGKINNRFWIIEKQLKNTMFEVGSLSRRPI